MSEKIDISVTSLRFPYDCTLKGKSKVLLVRPPTLTHMVSEGATSSKRKARASRTTLCVGCQMHCSIHCRRNLSHLHPFERSV